MGDLMPGIPSVPGDETTWAAAVDQFETLKKGDMPLSLTNWDASTTIPAIAAGSAIEVAGGVYRYPAEQAIFQSGTAARTYYVYIAASNGSANFTVSVPEWRADLTGWYNAAGDRRYTGHMMDWDGADAYTNKTSFITTADGKPPALTTNDGQLRFKIYKGTIAAGSTVSFPKDFIGEIVLQSKIAELADKRLSATHDNFDNIEVWSSVQSILVAAGNVSKILWPQEKKYAGRGKRLRELLEVDDNNILSDRSLRN